MRKALTGALFAAAAVFASATHAAAYYGDFYLSEGPPYTLDLYDQDSDVSLHLQQTQDACQFDGNDPEFRRVLNEDGLSRVFWDIQTDCNELVRVCIRNSRGSEACTTWARIAAPH